MHSKCPVGEKAEGKVYKSTGFPTVKMVVTQHRSHKKPTGARYISARGKRKYEKGRLPTMTRLGEARKKLLRIRGGKMNSVLQQADTINLLDPKTRKYSKVKIKNVIESPANRHFIRRNILTKGTVVETEKGKAKITNRPGQEGSINAVLVSE